MVSGLNRTHRDFSFRYVPDVEVISVIGPGRILLVLAAMLADVENQFDIWQDE